MSAPETPVVIGGIEYAPKWAMNDMRDERDSFRRTLALVHAHLIFDGPELGREAAVRLIQRDMEWTFDDARAVRSIMQSVRNGGLS